MKIPAFTKSYGGRTVLRMPELELESGKLYAVTGANGSGKTTLARVLSGVEDADNGQRIELGASIGYMPQKSYAFRMSVRANLRLSGGSLDAADALMARLGIAALADKPAHRLSGGETARMALVRLLMGKYELLILDEPTAAMDMESTAIAEELIQEYREAAGCTVLLITHSLQQARRVAHEVLFFDNGELVEHGEKNTLLYSPATEKAKRFLEFYGA